ncbi:MAG TPA: hypothetical protein VGM22_06920 [Methylomirabilota bacterium]
MNCSPGTFNAQAGATLCTSCPAGRYSETSGAVACAACAPGTFNPTTGGAAASACKACEPGHFAESPGSAQCADCVPGTFSASAGAKQCEACPLGMIANQSAAAACESCPTGQYAFVEGSTACTACAVQAPRGSVQFTKVGTDKKAGNDGLAIDSQFQVPFGFASLDPSLTGARVIVQTVTEAFVLDAALPPGVYAGKGTRGWELRQGQWEYTDTTGLPVDGITSMTLAGNSLNASALVQASVKGTKTDYAVNAADEPLRVVIAVEDVSVPQCSDSAFQVGDCVFDKKQRTLTCQQPVR